MSLDTLAYIKTRSPLRVSIVFAVGIILPSGFLSYLGLRSYRYEDKLMQRETEERFAAVADLIEKKVAGRLSDLQSALHTLAGQSSVQHREVAQLFSLLLSKPKLDHLATENVYVFDEMDQMVVPWHEDAASGLGGVRRRELDWGSNVDEIERLERLEFVQKDYMGALHGYTALQSQPLTPTLQAALLKNIAGDYRKLHQNRMAEATYQKLARNYDQLPDFSGYPTGILARQSAIEINEEDHAWGNALDTRLDLLEGLLLHRWKIPQAQRKALMLELRTAVEHSLSNHPRDTADRKQRWERLQSLQERLETLEESGKYFAKNDWPDLLRRVRRQGRLDQGAILQMAPSGTPRLAVVVPILTPQTDHRRGYLVSILSASLVWPMLNEVMDELARPAGLKVEWEHSASKSSAVRQLLQPTLQREVPAMDPPLRFSLIDVSSSTRDKLSHRRQWIFGGVIGLSFLVILVGLVIMAQAVKRETEVANLKADFVANVSHELRTPLAAISHIGERLSLGRYRTEEERKEFYSLLGQETHRLRGLIEDILDFSKMLAGKKVYRREPLDLVELVQESISRFKPKADARGFTLLSHLPPKAVPILGDSKAITQAFLNLLDNSLKYSGESRQIDIQVSKTVQSGILTVKDQGIGIAESDKGKIFEKFYRLEHTATSKEEGGVGLGLAMVKHVVEGHDGKIQVESKVGQGSTFSLVFPLQEEEQNGSRSRS